VRLLVHRQDHGVVRRIEARAHDIGGLGGELRVGAEAPGALAFAGEGAKAVRP